MLSRYGQPVDNALVEKSSCVRKSPDLPEKVRFEVTFIIELFLMQMIGERSKQVIVSRN